MPWGAHARPAGRRRPQKFPRGERERFINSVTRGKNQMPPWGDLLKPEEVEALWAYVVTGGKIDSAHHHAPGERADRDVAKLRLGVRVDDRNRVGAAVGDVELAPSGVSPMFHGRCPTGMVATMAFVAVSSTETEASPPLEM